jgi:hypothetical protein
MILDHTSRLVRWTYVLNHSRRYYTDGVWRRAPHTTTLCRFFWRAFVLMPILWSSILFGFVHVSVLMWEHLHQSFVVLSLIAAAIAMVLIIAGIGSTIRYAVRKGTLPSMASIANSTFVQGLKAIKRKVCPIITIT